MWNLPPVFSALRVYAISGYHKSLAFAVFMLIILRAGIDLVGPLLYFN